MKMVIVQALAFAALMVVLAVMAVVWLPQLGWVGVMQSAPGGISTKFMFKPVVDQDVCEKNLRNLERSLKLACADCQIEKHCTRGLSQQQRALMSGEKTGKPVLHSSAMLVIYEGGDAVTSQQICEESARQAKTMKPTSNAHCVTTE
jgi:hypothetical protein